MSYDLSEDDDLDPRWHDATVKKEHWHFHRQLLARYGVVMAPGEFSLLLRDILTGNAKPIKRQSPTRAVYFAKLYYAKERIYVVVDDGRIITVLPPAKHLGRLRRQVLASDSEAPSMKASLAFLKSNVLDEALLIFIAERGGSIHLYEAYEQLADFFSLSDDQRHLLRADGGNKWEDRIHLAVDRLVGLHYIIPPGGKGRTAYGLWRLSELGHQEVAKLVEAFPEHSQTRLKAIAAELREGENAVGADNALVESPTSAGGEPDTRLPELPPSQPD